MIFWHKMAKKWFTTPFYPQNLLKFSSKHEYLHVEAHTIHSSAGDLVASIVTETYMES